MKGFLALLVRFGRRASWERRLILVTAAWLPIFSLGLRLLGLMRFQRLLSQTPLAQHAVAPPVPSETLGRIVNITAQRVPWRVSCLERSLLLWWLLKRRGTASDLKVGVRFTEGALDAHAWIECDAVPVNDTPGNLADFSVFTSAIVPLSKFKP